MRHPLTLILLLTLAAPAAAQMYGPDYAKCREKTTVDIVDCVKAATQAWDRRLNTAYQGLMQRSDPAQKDPLKAAQRLWIQYRDANCRFYASGEGSIRQIEATECLRAMTQHRACELEAANNQEGGARSGCQ